VGENEALALPRDQMAEFRTVQRWLGVLGEKSAEDVERRLDVLWEFCRFYGKDADALVEYLFRQTPEGPRIRLKRRRAVMARIEEFEAHVGGGRPDRNAGNLVRSFLINNGVAMTARPLW
jgi:hypothetical protein